MSNAMRNALVASIAALGICVGFGLALILATPSVAEARTDSIAEQFGAKIIWENHCEPEERGGCFLPHTPDVIYVSEGMPADLEEYVILHELGHLMQHRLGQPFNECAADRFAQSLGSGFGEYCPVG